MSGAWLLRLSIIEHQSPVITKFARSRLPRSLWSAHFVVSGAWLSRLLLEEIVSSLLYVFIKTKQRASFKNLIKPAVRFG